MFAPIDNISPRFGSAPGSAAFNPLLGSASSTPGSVSAGPRIAGSRAGHLGHAGLGSGHSGIGFSSRNQDYLPFLDKKNIDVNTNSKSRRVSGAFNRKSSIREKIAKTRKQKKKGSVFDNVLSSIWPWGDKKGEKYSASSSKKQEESFVETPRDPAVVFFPTNQDSGCMDGSTGGGFNTFGFLSMMLAGYNLIGLISNNGNQNNDNNINRNNDNNNNNQQVNMANTPSESMTTNMIIAPPLPPGRFLNVEYKLNGENIKEENGKDAGNETLTSPREKRNARECTYSYTTEDQFNIVLTDLCLASLRLMAADRYNQTENSDCRHRIICQLNFDASVRGSTGRHSVEVGTLVLLSQLTYHVTLNVELVSAARYGRVAFLFQDQLVQTTPIKENPDYCAQLYPYCGDWNELTSTAEMVWM